jgi:GTP-binding protein
MNASLRNVAIIAHVDHGKTTLLDQLLYQSGMFRDAELDKLAGGQHGLIMDTNDLERERGITILSKNCAIRYRSRAGEEYKINLIDTPGHADFGGEVERVLKMADGALLLVDAFEGPMPQTRFVLEKALEHGLKPMVVVNKIDRPDARPDDVINEVFDLLVELDADDAALDFPVIYSAARDGWASWDVDTVGQSLEPVFNGILDHVPAPNAADPAAPLQMLVTTLDWSDYTGRIAIGRVFAGTLHAGQTVTVIDRDGQHTQQRALKVLSFDGLGRTEVDHVEAGDICAVVGLTSIDIGNTIAGRETPEALPVISVDEPTLHMTFHVNSSPVAGREGSYVTSRQLRERLEKELGSNVALRVTPGETPEQFQVSGRGLMHLGILLENMRREGYEVAAGKPRVIYKEIDGRQHEPIEQLVVDCPTDCQSSVMSLVGDRRAELERMSPKPGASGFVHLAFTIPARGLIGLRSRMMTATQGQAIMHNNFLRYEPMRGEIAQRHNGVMIATEAGQVTAYALDALFDRGDFFVAPGDQVYEGQIVGEHNKDNDIVVNVTKGKKLSNVRAAGKDDAAQVKPPRVMSLEMCLEYIQDDELVEVTPVAIRMRKKHLTEHARKRNQASA